MKKIICMLFITALISIPALLFSQANINNDSPVSFLKNEGQWNSAILYKSLETSMSAYFLKDGVSFSQSLSTFHDPLTNPFFVWNIKFCAVDTALRMAGLNGHRSKFSFLWGNDSTRWIIHPEEYSQLNYNSIYKHIDLSFYGQGSNLKYDYTVHPGGKLNHIKSCYEGIKRLWLNKDGELIIETGWNIQKQNTPQAWQTINGKQYNVKIEYTILNDTTFGFYAPEGYNPNFDLIIDPLFQMVWSTYTKITGGSNNINYCFSNAMDLAGNVYITGMVDGTFPITPGAYSGPGNVQPEVFVAKFASDGTSLIYWTYLPGSSSEFGVGIAVDSIGRAYVTGEVDLNFTGVTNFPSTANAFQPVHDSGSDAFLTVLNPSGSGLVYSTFLGGTGSEVGYGIDLGADGIAYITGYTSIGNFPVKATSPFPTGDNDAFVAKFDINQSGANSLIYSTRIGGGAFTYVKARSIVVNDAGSAYITGTISSSFGTPSYPITPGAYNSVFNTGQDGLMFFVSKLSATTPVSLDFSTFVAPGTASGIDLDHTTNDVYVAGTTYTFAFPTTTGALQPVHAGSGGTDAFAIRLNAAGTALIYSTFIGGSFYDEGTSIAVNSVGEAYVVGISQDSFPTSAGSFQPLNAGTYDFFVVNLNDSGTAYACGGSTYVGGSDADYSGSFYDFPAPHVSIQNHGGNNDTICVSATSHSQDFPTTPGSYGPTKVNGIADQPVFFKMTCIPAGIIPVVNISSTDSTWCDKKAIDFFDLSSNNPTSWQWYFPGANPDTSTLQNPTGIYYPSSGVFPVTLVACNSAGCDSVTFFSFINELPTPVEPLVTASGDTLCASGYVSYKWFETTNLTLVLGTDSCYIVTMAGNYFVIATDTNGCESASQTIVMTTSDSNINSGGFISIHPNPVSSWAILEFTQYEISYVSITITDVTGKEVKSISDKYIPSGNKQIFINMDDLDPGLYFCKLAAAGGMFYSKIIIQK